MQSKTQHWSRVEFVPFPSTGCCLISRKTLRHTDASQTHVHIGIFNIATLIEALTLGFKKINKSALKLDLTSSMRVLIILPPGQHRLEVAIRLWLWEIYKPSNIPACVSRRAFYEAAHSCDGKSLLPPCQNEITRCHSPWPVFVGLSELVCVCVCMCVRILRACRCQVNAQVSLF